MPDITAGVAVVPAHFARSVLHSDTAADAVVDRASQNTAACITACVWSQDISQESFTALQLQLTKESTIVFQHGGSSPYALQRWSQAMDQYELDIRRPN